jgi:hypothetical protein
MAHELGECRCCRKPIGRSQLACPPHWGMLPNALKDAIRETYSRRAWREYAANVTQADLLWQAAGIWKPPVPMSVRAKKGVDGLRDLLNADATG